MRGFISGFLFCSIDLYFCLCASTILSWWLWLCSIASSQEGWFLQFHSSFSRLLWVVYSFSLYWFFQSMNTVWIFWHPWSRSAFFSHSCENLDIEWDFICGISDKICINIILGYEFLLYEQRNESEETTEAKSLKEFISMWYFPVQSFEWCLYGCAHKLGIFLFFPSSTKKHIKKIGATCIHGKVEANFLASCVIFWMKNST